MAANLGRTLYNSFKGQQKYLQLQSKEEFDDRKRKQDKLIKQLKNVKLNNAYYIDGEEIRKIENQINNILMDEEVYWQQDRELTSYENWTKYKVLSFQSIYS